MMVFFRAGEARASSREALLKEGLAPAVVQGLPIANVLEDIIDTLQEKNNLILQAPPGAGKTTVVPLALLFSSSAWLGISARILVRIPDYSPVCLHTMREFRLRVLLHCLVFSTRAF
jgi:ATP-dependent helicase HrpB